MRCSFLHALLCFICALSCISLVPLLLRKEYCSAEEVPPADVQTQLAWDKIRAFIFYIVPSSVWKSFGERKNGVLL
jgi:hypothetical protein